LDASEATGSGGSAGSELADRLIREEDAFGSRISARHAVDPSPPAQLRVILEECAADYNVETWIELWSLARRDRDACELRQRIDDEFRLMIERVVRAGQESGDFGKLPPADVALTLASIIDGFSIQATLHDETVTSGYMLSAFIDAAELLLECELPPCTTGTAQRNGDV
jgi:GAF domain-containing protein